MAEYIEREALKSQISENKLMAREPAAKRILAMIDDMPAAADVAPVVHGRWVYGEFDIPHCSECGNDVMPNMISPYCPNCGAKMDGEG